MSDEVLEVVVLLNVVHRSRELLQVLGVDHQLLEMVVPLHLVHRALFNRESVSSSTSESGFISFAESGFISSPI